MIPCAGTRDAQKDTGHAPISLHVYMRVCTCLSTVKFSCPCVYIPISGAIIEAWANVQNTLTKSFTYSCMHLKSGSQAQEMGQYVRPEHSIESILLQVRSNSLVRHGNCSSGFVFARSCELHAIGPVVSCLERPLDPPDKNIPDTKVQILEYSVRAARDRFRGV